MKLDESVNGVGVVEDEDATYPEYTTGAYYPVSFGLYVNNGTYYRVHAEVTTLDSTKTQRLLCIMKEDTLLCTNRR